MKNRRSYAGWWCNLRPNVFTPEMLQNTPPYPSMAKELAIPTISLVTDFEEEKIYISVPKPFTWPWMLAHTHPDPWTPFPFHSPCWTPLKLYPNIPISQGTFPHRSPCNTKSLAFFLMWGGSAKLFLIPSFWESSSETSWLTNWQPCRRLHDHLSLDSQMNTRAIRLRQSQAKCFALECWFECIEDCSQVGSWPYRGRCFPTWQALTLLFP